MEDEAFAPKELLEQMLHFPKYFQTHDILKVKRHYYGVKS